MSSHRLAHFSAGRVILLAIGFVIVIGTFLLSLPIARVTEIPLIDLFFTATSATCVTGLFTIPLTNFTQFGHWVILFLVQIGGLGIITLTMFLVSLLFDLGFTGQRITGQLLELESHRDIKKLLLFIVSVTAFFEILGASCFFLVFKNQYPTMQALFFSLFHAVSFFCSAGITLFNNSFAPFAHNYIAIITATILMFFGGIGFITLYELLQRFNIIDQHKRKYFSLQSKIVIYGSLLTIFAVAAIIWFLERHNAFASMNSELSILNALFHAVSFRSTGLLTVSIAHLQLATIFIIMIISFIGSAPASTGSGVRITTFSIYLAIVKAAVTAHTNVNIRGRRIAKDQLNKATAIISLSLAWIVITTFFLLITEKNWEFIDILFESVCAFTNLGLTTGITLALTFIGKIFIIMSMIIGRIGSLTLILALRKIASRKGSESTEAVYPEERIMLS
jgi:trk system potassium uptake protein TrkH